MSELQMELTAAEKVVINDAMPDLAMWVEDDDFEPLYRAVEEIVAARLRATTHSPTSDTTGETR